MLCEQISWIDIFRVENKTDPKRVDKNKTTIFLLNNENKPTKKASRGNKRGGEQGENKAGVEVGNNPKMQFK